MRVGVYIDGFNLYYGGRSIFGRGTPGWKWLDLRKLGERLVRQNKSWRLQGAEVANVVYCTAFVSGRENPHKRNRQDRYVAALTSQKSYDIFEEGKFFASVRSAPLGTLGPNQEPEVAVPKQPVLIHDKSGKVIRDARFIVSYLRTEEKRSDVNLASHLLLDVLQHSVDAVLVVSNDSDLCMPLRECRKRVPTCVINPSKNPLANSLGGDSASGVGGHWWYKLSKVDFLKCQLPTQIGDVTKPQKW